MKKIILGMSVIVSSLLYAEGTVVFETVFGGEEDDVAKSVVKTDDGYLIAGKTKSFTDHRDFGAYVIKIDKQGKKLWSKVYGGKDDEEANDIVRFGKDFVFVGSTETYGNENLSFYMVKIDSEGKVDWQTTYYRDDDDQYNGNALVADGDKLIFAGTETHLQFFGAKVNPYIFSTNKEGDKLWGGFYGGEDEDDAHAIISVSDGYVMAGKTESYGHGDFDSYIVKLDKTGKNIWHAAYGGKDNDCASDVIATDDGYLMVGTTESFDNNYKDVYVVKTDKKGNKLWQRTYGGSRDDQAFAVTQAPDGNYVMVGKSESFTRRNGSDLYLIKIDTKGKKLWERTYGGESDDAGYDIVTTEDGYLIVGDKKTDRRRDSDVWVLKVNFNGKLRKN